MGEMGDDVCDALQKRIAHTPCVYKTVKGGSYRVRHGGYVHVPDDQTWSQCTACGSPNPADERRFSGIDIDYTQQARWIAERASQ